MAALSDVVSRHAPPATIRIVLSTWVVASLALLVLYLSVSQRLSRARRTWRQRSVDGTPVRVATDVGPAVIGFIRAEIVVPHWLLERPADERCLILAHEREHLRARDHLLLGGAWLAAIAIPWHPVVWYLVSRIRLAIELDCDARVVRGGALTRSYAALLIDTATRQSAMRIGALALADAPSHLERRIRAMHWRRGRLGVPRGLVMGAAGGLVVLAACEARVPTSAEVASMDVSALEKRAAELDHANLKLANADYFVNGAPVSGDSARSIAAARIGSVGIMKARSVGGRDTVQITTVDRKPSKRMQGDDDIVPPSLGGLSASATLVIDGVVQTPGTKVRQDPKQILSISVMKPGKDPRYPNGLIAIETKGHAQEASPSSERKVTVTRTDSVSVSSARGLASAAKFLTGRGTNGPNRVALMPGGDSASAYRFGVGDLERASSTTTRDTSGTRAKGVTMDPTKPVAIEIDAKPATKAELDQLRSTAANLTFTMYPHDMSAESSDPAAKNGLLRVTTKAPTKH
jgi:hypothetical protein